MSTSNQGWWPDDTPRAAGVDRRDFMKACAMAAAAVGLPATVASRFAEAAVTGLKPSVIWLHFQECTGCTESLLRTSARIQASNSALRRTRQTIAGARLASDNDTEYRRI